MQMPVTAPMKAPNKTRSQPNRKSFSSADEYLSRNAKVSSPSPIVYRKSISAACFRGAASRAAKCQNVTAATAKGKKRLTAKRA